MTSHLALMFVFSVMVSIVFATLMRDEPGSRFGSAPGCSPDSCAEALVGWLLYPLPL